MDRRLKLVIGGIAAAGLAASIACTATPSGQGQNYAPPKAADGNPDVSGVWQAVGTAYWNLEDHPAQGPGVDAFGVFASVPAGQGVVEGGEIPYKPEALAHRKELYAQRMTADLEQREVGDPELKCFLPGVPRATYMPYPFQIVQSKNTVTIAYEFSAATREIHMDKHEEAPIPSWMGWSNGKWEGNSLVVDVTGFNGQTWLDRAGNFHGEKLHVVERYTPITPYHMQYEATIEDPDVFTRPWKISLPLYRRMEKDARIYEFRCVEFVEPMLLKRYDKIKSTTH